MDKLAIDLRKYLPGKKYCETCKKETKIDIMRLIDWALIVILALVILYAKFIGTYDTVNIEIDRSMCNMPIDMILNITGYGNI